MRVLNNNETGSSSRDFSVISDHTIGNTAIPCSKACDHGSLYQTVPKPQFADAARFEELWKHRTGYTILEHFNTSPSPHFERVQNSSMVSTHKIKLSLSIPFGSPRRLVNELIVHC
jgi:hypothetical protein